MESSKDTALSLLASLQDLDRVQKSKTEMLQSLQAEIAKLESELAGQRAQTLARQAERDGLKARQRELERQMEDEETKLKDRRMRLNRVRNEKELQALRREIEVGRDLNQKNEEELLRVMEAIDSAQALAAESEEILMVLEDSISSRTAESQIQIKTITESVESEKEERSRVAASLDSALLRKYEQIFARRGGTAVVEVRSGICQGCHMNLPPQLANELQRTTEIRLCPNCHRILFCRIESIEGGASQ